MKCARLKCLGPSQAFPSQGKFAPRCMQITVNSESAGLGSCCCWSATCSEHSHPVAIPYWGSSGSLKLLVGSIGIKAVGEAVMCQFARIVLDKKLEAL